MYTLHSGAHSQSCGVVPKDDRVGEVKRLDVQRVHIASLCAQVDVAGCTGDTAAGNDLTTTGTGGEGRRGKGEGRGGEGRGGEGEGRGGE